jgi:rubredoxin-NAD+ reductase
VLLIGAGLIGCEFANDLAATGYGVSLVDPAPRPLARLLPEAIGTRLAEALAGIGCALHLGRTVARYKQAETGFVAELDDGTRVPFDHALSAVGLAPRTALAKAAGLDVGVGILVDRLMRTSDPAIFALGDCVQTPAGPLPYIAPLLAQARAIAATLTGAETALVLPAMPVVVKTPALPIALCPPPAGSAGTWEQALGEGEATALFRAPDGRAIGFALAGAATARQHALAREMPDMLPEERAPAPPPAAAGTTRWECRQCGHVYDPAEGDPDSGIPPGTPWEAVPEDWCCPLCGAGKDAFDPLL